MDQFNALINDLSSLIAVPIHIDSKKICSLHINNKISVRIEDQQNLNRILIASFVCEIPPGKFRENIFKETLKENNHFPRLGSFAYVSRSNQLCLFAHIYYDKLNGEILADFLEPFIDKVLSWQTAVLTGQLPQGAHTIHKVGPSIFDIKRS